MRTIKSCVSICRPGCDRSERTVENVTKDIKLGGTRISRMGEIQSHNPQVIVRERESVLRSAGITPCRVSVTN